MTHLTHQMSPPVSYALMALAQRDGLNRHDKDLLKAAAQIIDNQNELICKVTGAIGPKIARMGVDYTDAFKLKQYHAALNALYPE